MSRVPRFLCRFWRRRRTVDPLEVQMWMRLWGEAPPDAEPDLDDKARWTAWHLIRFAREADRVTRGLPA